MVAVFVLKRMCGLPSERAHATAISIMLPLTIVSVIIYLINGSVQWDGLIYVAPSLLAGSLVGAKVLGKINALWLNRIFSILMLAAAVWMII